MQRQINQIRVDVQNALTAVNQARAQYQAAVKANEIAGTVDPGEDGDVHITANAKALDKFLASPRGAALFSKPLVTMTRQETK